MSAKASPTLIGFFTLVGLILAGIALVLFGAGKFLEKSSRIILYFDQSANGLLIGSDVRFGGVRIGRVESIQVLIDPKENRKIIPIIVELSAKDLKAVGSTSGDIIDFASPAGVQKAVASGLRAKMKQQSLLTGQLYIEFDIEVGTPGFIYQSDTPPRLPSVPTMGTEMDALITGVADGLKKLNTLDLESAMKDLREVLVTAKTQIAALNLKAINDNLIAITTDVRTLTHNEKLAKAIDQLDTALATIDSFTKKANTRIDPLLDDLQKVLIQTNAGLVKIDAATADIAKITNPRAPTLLRLQNVLKEIERSSLSIRELANDLQRHPDAVVRGKAPTP